MATDYILCLMLAMLFGISLKRREMFASLLIGGFYLPTAMYFFFSNFIRILLQ